MRIIGGRHQRRLIRPPAGLPVRPTTDKAKEALFNILNNYFDFTSVEVLDLFSGTGSISYEFASRGAAAVVAVENNFRCYRYIKRVKEELELEQLQVIRADAFAYLKSCPKTFDIIFADPPFDMAGIKDLPETVLSSGVLSADGWLVVEHPPDAGFERHHSFISRRKYSKVHFSIFSPGG